MTSPVNIGWNWFSTSEVFSSIYPSFNNIQQETSDNNLKTPVPTYELPTINEEYDRSQSSSPTVEYKKCSSGNDSKTTRNHPKLITSSAPASPTISTTTSVRKSKSLSDKIGFHFRYLWKAKTDFIGIYSYTNKMIAELKNYENYHDENDSLSILFRAVVRAFKRTECFISRYNNMVLYNHHTYDTQISKLMKDFEGMLILTEEIYPRNNFLEIINNILTFLSKSKMHVKILMKLLRSG